MRRRSFRPALESLDLRITPSGLEAVAMTAPAERSSIFDLSDNDNPLWNEPTDTGDSSSDTDNGYIWCPPIGI